MICRTLDEIYAAAERDHEAMFEKYGPMSQETANRIAAILAPYICRECGGLSHAPGCKAAP
jgi:hypothetical protein